VKKSETAYRDGILHGARNDYYKNGAVLFAAHYEHGKIVRTSKSYYVNGQLQHELRPKKHTAYDTSVLYYSNGTVRETKLIKNGTPVRTKRDNDLAYNNTMYWQAINTGNLKDANKLFYELWKLDSANIETYFKEGYLLLKEHRFDDAIAAFDKALHLEPLMRESLVHRALARLRKYQAKRLADLTIGSGEPPLQVEDMAFIPAEEQEKICRDLQGADYVDNSDLYVKKIVPAAFLAWCKNTSR
jgi:tetratricopeptide (TPR) repeat protein